MSSMITVKTRIGSLELIKSNIVIIEDNQIDILVDDLTYTLKFTTDKDSDSNKSHILVKPDEKKLEITCVNFNNSLGEGLTKPAEIGTINGRKLFLSFYVFTVNSGRIVNYSLYTG